MKFPAEIMKHDPMDIRAFSANPHTVNHAPKHTSASFHQQVMLMSGQNDCHLPTSFHHIQNICTIQEMLTVSLPFATNDCCLNSVLSPVTQFHTNVLLLFLKNRQCTFFQPTAFTILSTGNSCRIQSTRPCARITILKESFAWCEIFPQKS